MAPEVQPGTQSFELKHSHETLPFPTCCARTKNCRHPSQTRGLLHYKVLLAVDVNLYMRCDNACGPGNAASNKSVGSPGNENTT